MRSPIRFALALAFLLVAPSLLSAQSYAIDRGSLLIGGTAGFSSTGGDFDDERTSILIIHPSVQYFVTRGLSFGGDISIQRVDRGGDARTNYGVGPSAMYFWGGAERTVYPYVSGGVRYVRSGDSDAFGYQAAGGAIVMLMDAVGLNGSLYYQQTEGDEFSTDSFGLALGIAAFVF